MEEHPGGGGRVLLLAAFAAHLPAGMALAHVPLLVPPAPVAATYAITWLAAAAAGAPLTAALAPGRVVALALVLATAGALAPLVDHGPTALAAGAALVGLAGGLLVPAARAFGAPRPRPARDLLHGRMIAAGGLALLAGPPLAALLAPQGLPLPPLAAAAIAAIALAAVLLALPARAEAGEPAVVAGHAASDHGKDG